MIKVLVGVIAAKDIAVKTVQTLLLLIRNDHRVAELVIKQGPLVYLNREHLVLDALKKDFTHLFFVDSDVCFTPDTLDKLLAHDKDIVAANYNMRIMPLTPTVRMLKEGKEVVVPMAELPKDLFKCYAAATGCMLIKMDVFKKLKRPWFFYEAPSETDEGKGEDVFFCKKAHEAGYDVWLDPKVQVGHIGEFIY